MCLDSDSDGCDDCSLVGFLDANNDGTDTDGDGVCDMGDIDIDNDGVVNAEDSNPLDPFLCGDSDGDLCDDCMSGTFNPSADGTDADQDGYCTASDCSDDNPSIHPFRTTIQCNGVDENCNGHIDDDGG